MEKFKVVFSILFLIFSNFAAVMTKGCRTYSNKIDCSSVNFFEMISDLHIILNGVNFYICRQNVSYHLFAYKNENLISEFCTAKRDQFVHEKNKIQS